MGWIPEKWRWFAGLDSIASGPFGPCHRRGDHGEANGVAEQLFVRRCAVHLDIAVILGVHIADRNRLKHPTVAAGRDAIKPDLVENESPLCGDRESVVDAAERFGLERAIGNNRTSVRQRCLALDCVEHAHKIIASSRI